MAVPVYELVLAARDHNTAPTPIIGRLYRREPGTDNFITAWTAPNGGSASTSALFNFTNDPSILNRLSVGIVWFNTFAHTEDGVNWAIYDNTGHSRGQRKLGRDNLNGDLYSLGGATFNEWGIDRSTDNGVTWDTFLTVAQIDPDDEFAFVRAVAVHDGVVWFVSAPTGIGEVHAFYRVNTDGTDLTQVAIFDELIEVGVPFLQLMASPPAAQHLWYFGNEFEISETAPVWRINTETDTVTELAGPPRSGKERIGAIYSLTETRVIAHVLDDVRNVNEPNLHTGLLSVYESNDDGETWELVTTMSAGTNSTAIGEAWLYGPSLAFDDNDSTHLVALGAMPNYYESFDSGETWATKTFTPTGAAPSWTAIGLATLGSLVRRGGSTAHLVA